MGKLRYDVGHNRWKGLEWNYDDIHGESEDRCFYCLTKQQVAFLLAALEPGRWKTRWYSLTDQVIDTNWLDEMVSSLQEELMADHCNIDTAIEQIQNDITNINNNIVTINTDIDVINTNIEVINTNIEVINTDIDIIQNNVINITYQNNTTNITNVTVGFYTFSANSADSTSREMYSRYNALCKGILDWIYSVVYTVQQSIGASGDDLADIQALIGANRFVLGLLFHGAAGYGISDIQPAILSSSDVDAIACHMVTYLAQLPMTFQNFSDALSTFSSGSAYQTILAAVLDVAIAYYDGFAGFVMMQQAEFEAAYALNPTDFDCPPCNPGGFCSIPQTWDFTIPQLIPWIIERGTLTLGAGVVGVQIPGDLNYGFDVSIYFPTPCTSILTHKVEFTARHLPSGVGNSYTLEFWYLNAGVPTRYNQSSFLSATWPTATTSSTTIPSPPGGAGVYRIRFYCNTAYYGNATSQASNAAELQKVRFIT